MTGAEEVLHSPEYSGQCLSAAEPSELADLWQLNFRKCLSEVGDTDVDQVFPMLIINRAESATIRTMPRKRSYIQIIEYF